MALAQTDLPELKRFNFFVSRRFEEGRERFRLHMGYFATLAEAEEWLSVVREIYPGAWAGEAPGRKLRERAAAAQAAQAQHAAGPQQQVSTPRSAPAPVAVTPPPRAGAVSAAATAADGVARDARAGVEGGTGDARAARHHRPPRAQTGGHQTNSTRGTADGCAAEPSAPPARGSGSGDQRPCGPRACRGAAGRRACDAAGQGGDAGCARRAAREE